MSISPSSSVSETIHFPSYDCQFYHEDFKVVMPICTQQAREGERDKGIMTKRFSWAKNGGDTLTLITDLSGMSKVTWEMEP